MGLLTRARPLPSLAPPDNEDHIHIGPPDGRAVCGALVRRNHPCRRYWAGETKCPECGKVICPTCIQMCRVADRMGGVFP